MSGNELFHTTLTNAVRPKNYENYEEFMAECHHKLDELEVAEDPVDHLSELAPKYWRPIAGALGKAPLETLQRYGERTLAWTDLRYVGFENAEFQAAMAQTSYNVKQFERASAWGLALERHNLAFVEAQYSLATKLEDIIDNLPMEEIITDSLKLGSSCKPKQLGAYSLRALEESGHAHYGYLQGDPRPFSRDIFLDAPLGVAICYKDVPQVFSSISLSYPTELMAYQLQTLKVEHPQSGRGWPRLDWKAALIGITERVTVDAGLAFTGIQAAKNNDWVRPENPKRNLRHFRQFYDIPAEELGYWQGQDDNWHIQHAPQLAGLEE